MQENYYKHHSELKSIT